MSTPRRHDWLHQHKGKRSYPRRWQARLRCAVLTLTGRPGIRPYPCTWKRSPAYEHADRPHWHVGHSRAYRSIPRRLRYRYRRLVLWPFYRARRRYRMRRRLVVP